MGRHTELPNEDLPKADFDNPLLSYEESEEKPIDEESFLVLRRKVLSINKILLGTGAKLTSFVDGKKLKTHHIVTEYYT